MINDHTRRTMSNECRSHLTRYSTCIQPHMQASLLLRKYLGDTRQNKQKRKCTSIAVIRKCPTETGQTIHDTATDAGDKAAKQRLKSLLGVAHMLASKRNIKTNEEIVEHIIPTAARFQVIPYKLMQTSCDYHQNGHDDPTRFNGRQP